MSVWIIFKNLKVIWESKNFKSINYEAVECYIIGSYFGGFIGALYPVTP